tara:strand:- start:926 stop:1144 length:219 start_codon:yes stop_codon:yes gene_type:complete
VKVGDLVRPYGSGFSSLYGPENAVHMIIGTGVSVGTGVSDWDWEVWFAGSEGHRQFIWHATKEELEVISESG